MGTRFSTASEVASCSVGMALILPDAVQRTVKSDGRTVANSQHGGDQQAGQSHAAQFVGGSGTERSALCSRVAARLSAAEAQETFWRRQGHGGAQIGGAAVLDVEDAAALPVARTQGTPVIPWSLVKTGRVSGHPASQKSLGVRRQESWSPRLAIE